MFTVEHLLALLATYAAGKVWVPLNPTNSRADLDRMIGATRPTLFVADESCLESFSHTDAPIVVAKTTAAPGEMPSVRGFIAEWNGRHPTVIAREASNAQIIKFSGGSTGAPKPVVQSVRCVNAQVQGILACFELDAGDVNLIAAPLTHGASCFVLPILSVGGRHVMIEEPKAPRVLDAIERYAVTTMYAPPTLIYSMLEDPADRHDPELRSHAPPDLLRGPHASGPDPQGAARLRPGGRNGVRPGGGAADHHGHAGAKTFEDDENVTSIGRHSPVAEVVIMGPTGDLLPNGETGEIVVQRPLVINGYLDRPDLTAQTIIDGWLHTGDLGMMDDRGYVHIRGRLRELINTGGFKVFPGDVEATLAKHAAVAECAVFGVPDDKWGEAVHAAVRVSDGAAVTAEELMAFVKAELGSVKAPKVIHFIPALPRNAAGKVSRAAVRAMVQASDNQR